MQLFDRVMTAEDLDLAEKVLVRYSLALASSYNCLSVFYSFRHSLSWPRSGLPLVVIRACVRVGKPNRALYYVRNKASSAKPPTSTLYLFLSMQFQIIAVVMFHRFTTGYSLQ